MAKAEFCPDYGHCISSQTHQGVDAPADCVFNFEAWLLDLSSPPAFN